MKIRHFYLALTAGLLLVAAACGSSDDGGDAEDASSVTTSTAVDADQGNGDETATTTSPAEDGGSEPQDQPAIGDAGSFTVNDTEFAVTLLNRCIPFQDREGDFDLQALAQGAKLNLVLFGGSTDVSVDGSTVNEMFGSIAFGEDPIVAESEITGDRWIGSATVADSLGSGESVDLTWDVMVPDEIRDCSL